MLVSRFAWPLRAGILAVVFSATAGCPSSAEKSGDRPRSSLVKESSHDDSTTDVKLPSDEFQQPPVVPASEPPPKLIEERIDEHESAGVRHVAFSDRTPAADQPAAKRTTPSAGHPAPLRPRTAKNSGVPFDPVAENGPIFVGWPKPKAAIVVTGMEHGYIEPCGCAGLDRMKGGMSRRYSLLQEYLRKKMGWPVVAFDLGGLANGRNAEAEMKFRALAESKAKMGYSAVGFGAGDLQLPAAELVLAAADVDGKPSVFVAANVALFGFDQHVTQTSRVVEAGGVKIGVTAILGKQYQKQVDDPQVEMIDPGDRVRKIAPELKRNADYLVLLANAPKDEAIELARRFPEFNAVVATSNSDVPPDKCETIDGSKTLLITVGHKGMYAVVLGLFDDPNQRVRYQRVPLDSRFPLSTDMKRIMAAFQEQLKAIGFAGLGLRPVPHPLADTNGRFVGSKKCESCHEKSYEIWKHSAHARAYQTLSDLDPPRNFDPECVSCHVVGWHPTKFFPYQSGFESLEKTPYLINAGCEGCHGPGEKHVKAELGNNEKLQEQCRKTVVVTKEQSKKEQCMTSHNLDNSPDFNFDLYWPLVEHHEKEAN